MDPNDLTKPHTEIEDQEYEVDGKTYTVSAQ
jgi:hypothetical protein